MDHSRPWRNFDYQHALQYAPKAELTIALDVSLFVANNELGDHNMSLVAMHYAMNYADVE